MNGSEGGAEGGELVTTVAVEQRFDHLPEGDRNGALAGTFAHGDGENRFYPQAQTIGSAAAGLGLDCPIPQHDGQRRNDAGRPRRKAGEMGGLVVCQDFAGLRRAVVFGYIKEKPRIGRCFDVAVGSQGGGHDTGVAGIGFDPRQIAVDKRGHGCFRPAFLPTSRQIR